MSNNQGYIMWTDKEKARLIDVRIKLDALFITSDQISRGKIWEHLRKEANIAHSVSSTRKQWSNLCLKYKNIYKRICNTNSSDDDEFEPKIEELTDQWIFFDQIHKWAIDKPDFLQWVRNATHKNKSFSESEESSQKLDIDLSSSATGFDKSRSFNDDDEDNILINNITYEDFGRICRLCLKSSNTKLPIFNENKVNDIYVGALDIDVSSTITMITDLTVEEDDDFPQYICTDCLEHIKQFLKFRDDCRNTFEILRNIKICKLENENEDYYKELDESNEADKEAADIYIEDEALTFIAEDYNNDDSNILEETEQPVKKRFDEMDCHGNINEHDNKFIKKKTYNGEATLLKIEILAVPQEELGNVYNDQQLLHNFNENSINEGINKSRSGSASEHNRNLLDNKMEKGTLYSRVKNKLKTKREKCPQCGAMVTRLKYHLLVHSFEKPHQCKYCDKRFTYNSNLKIHMNVHEPSSKYKCDICGHLSTQSSSLKSHKLTHVKEKNFKCDLCDKTFTLKNTLRQHRLIHMPDRKFKCLLCTKSFLHRGDLIRHQRTHTGERPFKCDNCIRAFSSIANLKIHLKSHTDMYPFKCVYCSSSYKYRGILKNHLEKYHPDNDGSQ